METIDYKEKYKQALEVAQGFYNNSVAITKKGLEDIFPELKESEDERIRKELIEFCNNFKETGTWKSIKSIDAWIAWLENVQYAIDHAKREGFQLGYKAGIEKQGKQKPIDKIQLGKKYKCIASPRYSTFMIGEIYKPEDNFLCSLMNFCSDCFEPIEDEPKPIDKVEPKFNVGDIISDGFSEVKIVSIDKNNYNVTNDEIENDAHIGNWVVYFKDQDNWKLVEQPPADKVDQHSLPVSDDSSLPTFDESIYHPCTEEVYEQTPTKWSEDDELHIRELESLVKQVWATAEHENDKNTIHKMSDLSFFLKTLKPQLKQEWSE